MQKIAESAQSVHRGNKIIIMQAANIGLTGGSTPEDSDYDHDIVMDYYPRTIEAMTLNRNWVRFGKTRWLARISLECASTISSAFESFAASSLFVSRAM